MSTYPKTYLAPVHGLFLARRRSSAFSIGGPRSRTPAASLECDAQAFREPIRNLGAPHRSDIQLVKFLEVAPFQKWRNDASQNYGSFAVCMCAYVVCSRCFSAHRHRDFWIASQG